MWELEITTLCAAIVRAHACFGQSGQGQTLPKGPFFWSRAAGAKSSLYFGSYSWCNTGIARINRRKKTKTTSCSWKRHLFFSSSAFHLNWDQKRWLWWRLHKYNVTMLGTLLSSRGAVTALGGQRRQHRLWKRWANEKQDQSPKVDICLGPIYNII